MSFREGRWGFAQGFNQYYSDDGRENNGYFPSTILVYSENLVLQEIAKNYTTRTV